MSTNAGVVQTPYVHIHAQRGNVQVDDKAKEYKFGNTTVIIHSKLAHMSSDDKNTWFFNEYKNGNPVIKRIVDAAYECIRKQG